MAAYIVRHTLVALLELAKLQRTPHFQGSTYPILNITFTVVVSGAVAVVAATVRPRILFDNKFHCLHK